MQHRAARHAAPEPRPVRGGLRRDTMSTTIPETTRQRRAAEAAALGSTATTERGVIRYLLTHRPRAFRPRAFRPRPALTIAEREDRRALADPRYRRTLISRLRREAAAP